VHVVLHAAASDIAPDRDRFNQPTGPARSFLKDLRIELSAYDRTVVMDLSEYAQRTAGTIHTLLGYTPTPTPLLSLHADDARVPSPHVTTGQLPGGTLFMNIDGGIPSQEQMDMAFTRIYLARYTRLTGADPRPSSSNTLSLPDWLIEGVACNLQGTRRAEMADAVLERWQQGRDTSLLRFLDQPGQPDGLCLSTFFITWLASQPDRAETFRAILTRAGESPHALTATDVATVIPGCTNDADLAEQWERWILKNRKTVRTPGETSFSALAQFKSELLFTCGREGIPMGTNGFRTVGFSELIQGRDAHWVPAFAHSKTSALRLLQVGRSEPFRDAVGAYTAFFEALSARRSERILLHLLETARTRMAELERSLSPSGDAPAMPQSPEDELLQAIPDHPSPARIPIR
jgi:hypothetical protein